LEGRKRYRGRGAVGKEKLHFKRRKTELSSTYTRRGALFERRGGKGLIEGRSNWREKMVL